VEVTRGTSFVVELGSTPTTGYRWQLPTVPDGIELLDRDFTAPAGGAVGGGGTEVFHLRSNRTGHVELIFELRREWEAEPIETRTIEVDST